MQVSIEKLVFGGKGIGKLEDKTIFVPYVLPEEVVEITNIQKKGKIFTADLKNVLQKSQHRTNPECKYYGICGGCDYQHINYEKQVDYKTEILEETLLRIGKINKKVDKVIKSSKPEFYRNKVQFKIKNGNFGFFKPESNEVINIDYCIISNEEINSLIPYLKSLSQKYPQISEISVYIPNSSKPLIKMVVDEFIDIKEEDISFDFAGIGIYRDKKRVKIFGEPFGFEKYLKFTYRVSLDSFFQVNQFQINNFIEEVINEVPEDKSLVVGDIFCGVGLLTIPVAKKVKSAFGIEISKSAVKDANYNKKINNINNLKFYNVSASRSFNVISGFKPDILIFDPPRTGISKDLIEKIIKLKSLKKVIYVSCNPATLARDLRHFVEKGFVVSKLKMFDMFPQTHHIEAIAVLDIS